MLCKQYVNSATAQQPVLPVGDVTCWYQFICSDQVVSSDAKTFRWTARKKLWKQKYELH